MSGFVTGISGVEIGVIFGGGGWILGEKKVGDLVPVSPTFLTMFIFLLPTLFFSVRLYSEMTRNDISNCSYSTVTDLAKFLGLSTSQPLATDR